jgi:hypothetical protein
MTVLCFFPVFRAFDANGAPLAAGKLYSYQAGTSTPLATYTDQAGGTPNANPTILDSAGSAQVWLNPTTPYKLDLFSALDVHQANWPVDNIVQQSAYPVAVAPVASVNNATVLTAAALIPAGARVLGVTCKILVGFGTSNGLTAIAVGDGGVLDKWGISAALTTNALIGGSDAPAAAQARDGSIALYPTATAIVLTAIGGLFDGTGSIQVAVNYLLMPHRAA